MNRLILILILFLSINSSAQEIAITFDDAPTGDGPLLSGEERSKRIIQHLKDHEVKEAAFFVVTRSIHASNVERLKKYVDAGHLLANHSDTHQQISLIGTRNYILDVKRADSVLNFYPAYMKWFRYPFLDEGKTVSTRDSIRTALEDLHLTNGYVTVDNYDWYLNHLLSKARESRKKINEDNLRKVYIDHIYKSVLFYDNIARQHLGRSPKHVLLLHENDLSALFLGDLITYLKQKGWKIISPREAYRDPVARHLPDVLFNGQGRIAAIAREKGIAARDLVQLSEDEVFLENLVIEEKVFE